MAIQQPRRLLEVVYSSPGYGMREMSLSACRLVVSTRQETTGTEGDTRIKGQGKVNGVKRTYKRSS